MNYQAFILVVLSFFVGLSVQQESYCKEPGQCEGNSTYLASTPSDSYNECLDTCNEIPDCDFFTFRPSTKGCDIVETCDTIDDENCPDCLTGEAGCPRLTCYTSGACTNETNVFELTATTYNECLEACSQNFLCNYFTLYPDLSSCILYTTCNAISNATCSNCKTGEKGCSPLPEPVCEAPGVCSSPAVVVDDAKVPTYNECLNFCQSNPECLHFTFYPDVLDACVLFSECGTFDVASCPTCVSGDRTCPPKPDPICDAPGFCNGDYIGVSSATSSDECLETCYNTPDCNWYNYNTADNICVLTSDCLDYDSDRPNEVTGQVECYTYTPPSQDSYEILFITAGKGPEEEHDVELLDFRENPDSTTDNILPCFFKPRNYPENGEGAVATYIGGALTVCGGHDRRDCHAYNPVADDWYVTFQMSQERDYAAAVLTSTDTWWITGGEGKEGGEQGWQTTENYILNTGIVGGDPLPTKRQKHALIRIDATRYFLTGGSGDLNDGRRSWIYDSAEPNSALRFQAVADASFDRVGDFAGLVIRSNGEKEIVVAGGEHRFDSEIYNIDSNQWRPGPSLPVVLWTGASVPYFNTFLLVGGRDDTNGVDSDLILRYDEINDRFVQFSQRMTTGRRYHTAVFVPEDYVLCSF